MTQFTVDGADLATGKDRTEVIQAENEAAAIGAARAKGVLVSRVRVTGRVASPAQPTVDYAGPRTPPASAAVANGSAAPGAPPGTRIPPAYAGLSIASTVLMVYAVLLYLFGVVALIAGIYSYASSSSMPAEPLAFAALLMPGLAILFGGAMAHGVSAGLAALRDIAVNSFRTVTDTPR